MASTSCALEWAEEAEREHARLQAAYRQHDRNEWAYSAPGDADALSGEIETLRSAAADWRRAVDEAARTGESRIVNGYIVVR